MHLSQDQKGGWKSRHFMLSSKAAENRVSNMGGHNLVWCRHSLKMDGPPARLNRAGTAAAWHTWEPLSRSVGSVLPPFSAWWDVAGGPLDNNAGSLWALEVSSPSLWQRKLELRRWAPSTRSVRWSGKYPLLGCVHHGCREELTRAIFWSVARGEEMWLSSIPVLQIRRYWFAARPHTKVLD